MEPGSPAGAGAEAPAFYSERKLSRKQLKKLAKAEREYEEERRKELEAAQAVDTAQKRELARIESILRTHALRMEYVEPDGHCLFRALVRQLRPLIQSGLFDTYFPAADTETRSALLTWSTIPDEMEAVWLLRKTLASFVVGEPLLDAIDDPAERGWNALGRPARTPSRRARPPVSRFRLCRPSDSTQWDARHGGR
jgi:hypothetical protein